MGPVTSKPSAGGVRKHYGNIKSEDAGPELIRTQACGIAALSFADIASRLPS